MSDHNRRSVKAIHTSVFLFSLSFGFVSFILPIYSKELGASALEIGGLFSILTITTLIFRPVTGWALDRFGRKPFLVFGLLLLSCSRFIYVFADSISVLYLARFITGISTLFLSVSVLTIVSDLANPTERGKEMGKIGQVLARSSILGVFFGFSLFGFLQPTKAWQGAFLGYTAMALIAVWLAWHNVQETKPKIVEQKYQHQVKSIISIPLLKLMFIVFVTGTSTSMLAPIYLIFLQDKFTTDVGLLALAFLPGGLVVAFFAARLGNLSDLYGRISLMVIGFISAGILSLLIPHIPSLIWLTVLFALSNVAGAMSSPAQSAMVADIAGDDRRGKSYGLHDFSMNLGITIGPLLGGWMYDTIGKSSPFYLNGVILLFCGTWVLLFMRHPKHQKVWLQ